MLGGMAFFIASLTLQMGGDLHQGQLSDVVPCFSSFFLHI
jgi:hypothetical protein